MTDRGGWTGRDYPSVTSPPGSERARQAGDCAHDGDLAPYLADGHVPAHLSLFATTVWGRVITGKKDQVQVRQGRT